VTAFFEHNIYADLRWLRLAARRIVKDPGSIGGEPIFCKAVRAVDTSGPLHQFIISNKPRKQCAQFSQ
jgi:hypothetical protein